MDYNMTPYEIWEDRVGYDAIDKKMLARVYIPLYEIMEQPIIERRWINVVRKMLGDNPRNLNVCGYYSTICKILKDIDVISMSANKHLLKGSNWVRFYGGEKWDWFKISTKSGGRGNILNV